MEICCIQFYLKLLKIVKHFSLNSQVLFGFICREKIENKSSFDESLLRRCKCLFSIIFRDICHFNFLLFVLCFTSLIFAFQAQDNVVSRTESKYIVSFYYNVIF